MVTRQTESSSLSVFKTDCLRCFGGGFLVFFSGLGAWLSDYLCGGQEQGKNKSFFGENAGSAHVSWIKLCNLVQVRKEKGVFQSKQISVD